MLRILRILRISENIVRMWRILRILRILERTTKNTAEELDAELCCMVSPVFLVNYMGAPALLTIAPFTPSTPALTFGSTGSQL